MDNSLRESSLRDKEDPFLELKNQAEIYGTEIAKEESLRSQRLITSEYFVENDLLEEYRPQNDKKTTPIIVSEKEMFEGFSWTRFFEFVLYHFIYFFILGPLTPLILTPFTGKYLMRNILFIGSKEATRSQTLIWFLNIIAATFAWVYKEDTLFQIQLYLIFSTTMIRVMTVSTKYGTFPKAKMNRWRTELVPINEIIVEFVLGDWNKQNDQVVEKEIRKSIQKKELDSAIFHISFLSNVDPVLAEELRLASSYYKERTTSYIPMKYLEQPIDDKTEKYHGYSIFRYLIDQNKTSEKNGIFRIVLVFSVIRGLLPVVFSIPGGHLETKSIYWWGGEGLCILINTIYFNINCSLLVVHLKDILRKVFFMEQMSYFIAPRKFDGFTGRKLFPTINFLEAVNLRSWISMRKIAMDYGSRLDYRLQMDLAFCLIYYITILVLMAFNKIPIPALNSNIPNGGQLVIFVEAAFMIMLGFLTLLKGAKLNEFYNIHKNILNENRIFYVDMMRKVRYYIGNNPIKPNNYLYRFCVKNLVTCKCIDTSCEAIKKHLKNLDGITEEIMDDLEFDQKTHPFKVFGIVATKEFLASFAIGILSAGASILNNTLNREI